jgi:hypothetical protein
MTDMHLDDRLRKALSDSAAAAEPDSADRDLHVVVQRGRHRRRNRRLVLLSVAAAVVAVGILVAPRALDAIRSAVDTRPATRNEIHVTRGIITTIAGSGAARSSGDGGRAIEASIRYPFDVVVDSAGDLYILENGRIRKVDPSGRITTVAGPPTSDEATTLTKAQQLHFKSANALAIDANDNLYLGGGDGRHFVVSRISPSGDVTRIAGTGQQGFSGDDGPAIDATLSWVYDVAIDLAGNVYIVDQDNNRIRMVDTNGVITTIAGTGERGWSGDGGPASKATVDNPWGIAVDADANVYFTQMPSVVRRIDAVTGVITTIAGSGVVGYAGDSGPATEARLHSPEHIAIDAAGKVFIEDTMNHCIRMVDLNGTITTIVGMGQKGFGGDGGPANAARLFQPSGMVLTPDDVLYIADSGNNRVRRVIL